MSTPGALNLAQQHMRPQKVLMSQVGHAGTSATLHNITTLPKAGKYSFFFSIKDNETGNYFKLPTAIICEILSTMTYISGTISLAGGSGTITMATNLTTPTTVSVPSIPIGKFAHHL